MIDQGKLGAMVSWLIAGAPPPKSIDAIVEECVKRLRDIGLPLDIITLNGLFIHPEIRGLRVRWSESRGIRRETYSHAYMDSNAFYSTPTHLCMSSQRQHRYWVADHAQEDASRYMKMHYEAGYTDLVLLPLFNFDGTVNGVVEFGTKRDNGFTDDEIQALRRVQAPIARMKEYFTELFDKQITLATYVGEKTSREVLKGNIVLGGGETISAVVLFADVIGFTRLSNELPSTEVLKTLNRFFAAIDAAVGPNNGEILKFMGDGVLAIFQTPDDLTAQEAAANSALDAVTQARKALAEKDDGPAVDFRAALHIGEVFFGNIGSGSRLDFTAIGPTVNLASRMLDAASADNAHTVCSDAFLRVSIGLNATPLERHFKGFDKSSTMYIIE
jgi:adenylate cyclase